jgi:hypothetical protein
MTETTDLGFATFDSEEEANKPINTLIETRYDHLLYFDPYPSLLAFFFPEQATVLTNERHN